MLKILDHLSKKCAKGTSRTLITILWLKWSIGKVFWITNMQRRKLIE